MRWLSFGRDHSSQVSQLSTASLAEPSMKEFKYQIFQNPVLRYISHCAYGRVVFSRYYKHDWFTALVVIYIFYLHCQQTGT